MNKNDLEYLLRGIYVNNNLEDYKLGEIFIKLNIYWQKYLLQGIFWEELLLRGIFTERNNSWDEYLLRGSFDGKKYGLIWTFMERNMY
jgi:hypothetical protein